MARTPMAVIPAQKNFFLTSGGIPTGILIIEAV
jgi:hypothetical protein